MRRSYWLGTRIASIVAWAVVMPLSEVSAANRPSAHAVTHSRPIRTHTARVIEQHVLDPAAAVSRELSDQPVHPYLIEVRVVNTTVWLDSEKDYIRQGFYKIDENHHIPAAHRLARSRRAPRARTSWGSYTGGSDSQRTIRPYMIFMESQFKNTPRPAMPLLVPDRKRIPKLASVTE